MGKWYIRPPPPEGRETASEVPECKFHLRYLRRGDSSYPEYRIWQCQSVSRKVLLSTVNHRVIKSNQIFEIKKSEHGYFLQAVYHV